MLESNRSFDHFLIHLTDWATYIRHKKNFLSAILCMLEQSKHSKKDNLNKFADSLWVIARNSLAHEGMIHGKVHIANCHDDSLFWYATEAAGGLVRYAFDDSRVRVVHAHTFEKANASARVLTKCGFRLIGEVIHPNDGLVWRWQKHRNGVAEQSDQPKTSESSGQ